MNRKKRWWGIWARGAVTAFSLFVALDTFVIPASYSSVKASNSTLFSELESRAAAESTAATATESTAAAAAESTATAVTVAESTDVATADSDIVTASAGGLSGTSLGTAKTDDYSITVTKYQEYDTAIYVADITVSSAEIIKTALADDTYGKNITAYTSTIASENQTVLAINGDYYGAQESGYVIRNGVAYRETSDGEDILVLYADGSMKVLDSDDVTVQELLDQGVWQAWSFGPGLLSDGEVTVGENTEVSRAMNSNPRTAIGQIDDNHYVFVVSDGRTDESKGLSLYELAEFMESLGCRTAYNLDGGGSSTMYFNGSVINNPTTNGRIRERAVSDIVYIG